MWGYDNSFAYLLFDIGKKEKKTTVPFPAIGLPNFNPGFGGQKFIPSSVAKIRKLRQTLDDMKLEHVEIEVDGGISRENIKEVTDAGTTIVVAGSAVFNAPDPADMISQMKAVYDA